MNKQIVLFVLFLPLFGIISCKKEETPTIIETSSSKNQPSFPEFICNPEDYIACVNARWKIDSSTYWTGNNPNYTNSVIHGSGSLATYKFEFNSSTNERSVFYSSGSLINGSSLGSYSFPTSNDPTHLHMTIYSGKDVYIRYLSNERMEWIEFDPTGNNYNDSLFTYFSLD